MAAAKMGNARCRVLSFMGLLLVNEKGANQIPMGLECPVGVDFIGGD